MEKQALLTPANLAALLVNGQLTARGCEIDPVPVLKLFALDAGATWLLTEIDPDDEDHAFGLCDLGLGAPELGYVSIREISTVRGKLGLPIERDHWFEGTKPLSAYADAARQAGRVVT